MTDLLELQAVPLTAERLWPRPGGFLCLGCVPGPGRRPRHGEECWGRSCPCRCRAVLGLSGPFPVGDPTTPDVLDQVGRVA